MRRILLLICTLLISQTTLSQTSLFFNVSATGAAANLSITLCLNGLGPLSCQNYTVSALDLTITTTIPDHLYPSAGIKINTPGYTPTNCTPNSNGYCLFSVSDSTSASIPINVNTNNAPWYPSLEAFEHYNSGRSHVFPNAQFAGSSTGPNTIHILSSTTNYPSGYNMAYLDANQAFIYGGGYGNISGSIGAFVAKVNPTTLEPIWYNQLIDTSTNGEWDYPGSLGILNDGFLYVVYGYRLTKINPNTGAVVATLILPTGGAAPENTAFNGFNATSDGTIIMKSVYRQAGCVAQGPAALIDCPDPTDVPLPILISINPTTMEVIDNITLPQPVSDKPTISTYNGHNYVYLLEADTAIRYAIQAGEFILDSSWDPGVITLAGQTPSSSFVVVNDWVVTQTNTSPAATALSIIAINQGNALFQYQIQPFLGDPIPTVVASAFSTAAPGGAPAISWAPASISGDADNNLIYATDALPGEVAAIKITEGGLEIVWKASQVTTESIALINSATQRIIVGSDIPAPQIPGSNTDDYAVWRDAATGQEIARSPLLSAMTPGAMIQPYYSGDMFYQGQAGALIKLSPVSGCLVGC